MCLRLFVCPCCRALYHWFNGLRLLLCVSSVGDVLWKWGNEWTLNSFLWLCMSSSCTADSAKKEQDMWCTTVILKRILSIWNRMSSFGFQTLLYCAVICSGSFCLILFFSHYVVHKVFQSCSEESLLFFKDRIEIVVCEVQIRWYWMNYCFHNSVFCWITGALCVMKSMFSSTKKYHICYEAITYFQFSVWHCH